MTIPGVIFWFLLVWGLYSQRPVLLYLLFGSMALGTLAVIPPAITGGVTVLPVSVAALVFVGKTAMNRSAKAWIMSACLQWHRLGLLSLFIGVALLGALFLPSLFAGTPVIPFRPAGAIVIPSPLHPSSANLTQSAYLLLSALTAAAFAYTVRNVTFQEQLLKAFLLGGAVVVITGLMDMMGQKLGLQAVLTPFRNATYSLLTDDTIMGSQRIVGLMPEASSYGPLCVSFAAILAIVRPYYLEKFEHSLCIALTLVLLLLGWLSTSSTAILCLVVFGGIYGLDWCLRATRRHARGRASLTAEFYVGIIGCVALLMLVVFDPKIFDTIVTMINGLIFNKTDSSSYAVRSQWNNVTWQAMLDTYGLGIGVGASRSSNALVAVFGSTGFLGGGLYLLFILQTYIRRRGGDPYVGGIISALKLAATVPLVSNILTGTSPDFGPLTAILLGSVIGLSLMNVKVLSDNSPATNRAIVPRSARAEMLQP